MSPRRGRPPLAAEDATASITLRLPVKEFDAADGRAKVERLSLSEWVRQNAQTGDSRHAAEVIDGLLAVEHHIDPQESRHDDRSAGSRHAARRGCLAGMQGLQ